MAVSIVRKSKDEDEEEKRKQLLAQIQENATARKNAEIQAVKNSNVKFNNPYLGGGTYLAGKYVSGLGEGTTNIVQTLALGFQQGSKQASKEQTTWDKIKNIGKNTFKTFAYADPTMITRLMYDTTVGRDEFIQNANEVNTQIQQNASQADSTWKKATAYLGGYGSYIQKQYLNSGLNQLQTGAQSVGQVLGSEKSQQASQALLQADDKLHEPIDKLNEELSKSEGAQNKVIRRLGNASYTIGNMTPSILISALSGGAGASDATREALSLTSMGISAKGGSTREGLKQGLDLSTAERIGVSKGMVEVGTEKMWNGLSFLKSPDSKVGSAIRTWIGKQVEDRIKSQFGKTVLTKWIPDLAGESLEEFVSGIYDNWLDRATVDPNRGNFFKEQSLDTLIDTTLSTLLMNAPSYVLETKAIHDRNKSGNQTNVNTEESNGYKQNLQEMVNNLDIPNEMKAELQQTIDSNETITGEEYNNTKERIKSLVKQNTQQQIDSLSNDLNNQYIDIGNRLSELDNIKAENFKDSESRRFYAQQINKEFRDTTLDSILAGYPENRNGNRTVKQYKEIAKEYGKQMAENGLTFDEVRANTVGAWQYYEPNKNITRYDNQQKKNASFDRLNSQVWSEEVYNSYKDTMRTQLQQQQEALSTQMNDEVARLQDEENILIDTIDNLKPSIEAVKSSLVQSAEQYGYKGKQISEIQDLMKRRGINAYFDETQFNNDSEGAFYNPKTNEIVFNPNASQDQVIQELAVHEWYHDLKAKGRGEEIQKSVVDFLKNNKDYQDLRKSLENAYAKLTDPNTGEYLYDIESKEFSDMIDEEATAKTLQKVLGNETEIQRLINYKPSLARRIYDAVVDLLNKFTGGRIEKLYWQDVRNKFESEFNKAGISTNEGTTRYSVKENRQYLEKQFEELTGDSILRADAKLAGREVRNKQRQAGNLEGEMEALPYNEEAMNLYKKIKSSVKSSNYLYHSTPADRLQSIIENGLTIGNKQNQEGVSSKDKLYLSASEELANSFTPNDSITFRINPNAKLENLDSDLLGGEGAYTITNNIPPEMLQVKENGKWVRLDKSELAKTNSTQIKATDNQVREKQDNRFDMTDNDNISESGTMFFRTKDNGRYYVVMTNNAGSIIYEGDFSNKDAIKKTLGKDIANYIEAYSEDTNNELYIDKANQKRDYKMYHRPSDTLGDASNFYDNITGDAFKHPEYYWDMSKDYSKESFEALKKVKGNPEAEITIYRATPGNTINEGDWVTPSKKYAEMHNESQLDGKGNILEKTVKAKDVLWGGDDINEFGYYPQNKVPTKKSDIRYSLNTDNKGNKINPGMKEYLKDISSEELVKGKVPLVYHTTTGYGNQFTEFNPVGTEGYKFGQQVVNYFTDSEDMSKSYADGVKVEKANTKRINTIEEARELVKDKYNISKTEDGKYKVSNDEIKRVLDQFNKEYYSKWSLEEKEVFKKTLEKNRTDVYENILKPPTDKLNEYSIYEKVHQQYLNFLSDDTTNQSKIGILPTSIPTLVKQYINNENIDTTIKTYDSEKQLLKDLPNLISGYAKRQYSGYVKLTNPYVIEGKGNLWKFVEKIDDSTKEKQSKVYDSLSEKEKQDLIHIALNTESGYYGFDNQIDKRADLFMNALENVWENGKGLAKKLKPIWTTQDKGHIYNYIKTGFDEMQVPREYSYSTNEMVYKVLDMNKNGSNYDGLIIKDIVDYGSNYASDYNKPANVYVTFNSNQFKAQDNQSPTADPDIRYSEDTNFDDWANNNLPSLGEGKTTLGDLRTEQRLPVNQPETTQPILPTTNVQPTTENLEIPNEQTSISLGEQVNPSERKQRKTYKSIIESPVMSEEAKKVARKFIGQDTYTPDSNLKQLERADNIISRLGVEKALNQLESNAMEGRTIKAEDIATGDRLIEYYSKIGDSENLQRAIRATAMAGTQAGRSVQAFALLKHQTPQGMAVWIQNSVDKLNSQTKNGQFDFTTEMQEKILNSTEDNLQENVDEVMKELGQQVPQSLLGKLDTWRYFSMLANPKTHIRNIVGNFAMGLTQQVKSKVAGTIEQVTGQDRTHTSLFEKRSRANIDFAKNDLKNVSAQLGIGESKYSNPKNQIQQNQRVFKSDALEKSLGRMFKMNDNLLEAEDNFGLKNAYVRNLSDYMTANKLNPKTITNEQLQQARKVAVEEALRATFHQESSLASMLNQIENKNLASRILMGGLVPFKKTPINVAKSGFEYSPAGLAKAIVYDSVQLRKGNINVNEYIDNISKGLTGTGIALVGYALAEAGILKAGGDDDKDEKYRQAMGEQPYSIMINGKSYSLDWLAPTGIPLFVGAELNKLMHDKTEKDGETQNEVLKAMGRIADATTSLLNPMSEMSMISGLTSTIQSFSSDPGQALMNLVVSPVKSYVGQAVPTALGQVARTTDKYERDTSSTETGLLPKAIDQTKNQIMNKIPGLRQMLPTKKDVWGEEVETQDYFHNAVLPYTKKEIKTNAVDKELNDLFERTGESIYPSTSLSKTVTYEGSKTRLTNKDYNEFKENYGKTSYNILKNLISSKEYKSMTDEQKVKEIKDVYTYANNLNKTEYAEKKGIKFETPNDIQDVKNIKSNGGTETDYFKYKAITAGIDKDTEKVQALRDSSLSSKSKKAIYLSVGGFSGNYGKKDTFYPNTNIDINEYLDYKTADIQGVKDSNGKTINGTKKQAQLDYINNNISGYENRLLLMGKDYKLSRSQQQDLAQYIYTLDNAEDLFEMYSKNFTIQNGNVYYK